jgi:hypothetical protein
VAEELDDVDALVLLPHAAVTTASANVTTMRRDFLMGITRGFKGKAEGRSIYRRK